jgi:hypothetical protein
VLLALSSAWKMLHPAGLCRAHIKGFMAYPCMVSGHIVARSAVYLASTYPHSSLIIVSAVQLIIL